MCSTYMQGDMNSVISPAERAIPDDSKTLLLYYDASWIWSCGPQKSGII